MAHLITPALVKRAQKSRMQRATEVVDDLITVKVGRSVTRAHYDILRAVYDSGGIPCPKPLFFVESEHWNGIVMSTIQGDLLSKKSSHVELHRTVGLEIKSGLDKIQGTMASRFPHDGQSIYSVAQKGPITFPLIESFHSYRVTLEDFVTVMSDKYPQPTEWLSTQRSLLSDLAKGDIVFCHMDLGDRNILVKDGHLAGVIDWDHAGWYTQNMEAFCTAMKYASTRPTRGQPQGDMPRCKALLEAWNLDVGWVAESATMAQWELRKRYREEVDTIRKRQYEEAGTRNRRLVRFNWEAPGK